MNTIEQVLTRYYVPKEGGFDLDRDNVIKPNEKVEDKNGDGRLTLDEYLSFVEGSCAYLNQCVLSELVASIDEALEFIIGLRKYYDITNDTFNLSLEELLSANSLAMARYAIESKDPDIADSPGRIMKAIRMYYVDLKGKLSEYLVQSPDQDAECEKRSQINEMEVHKTSLALEIRRAYGNQDAEALRSVAERLHLISAKYSSSALAFAGFIYYEEFHLACAELLLMEAYLHRDLGEINGFKAAAEEAVVRLIIAMRGGSSKVRAEARLALVKYILCIASEREPAEALYFQLVEDGCFLPADQLMYFGSATEPQEVEFTLLRLADIYLVQAAELFELDVDQQRQCSKFVAEIEGRKALHYYNSEDMVNFRLQIQWQLDWCDAHSETGTTEETDIFIDALYWLASVKFVQSEGRRAELKEVLSLYDFMLATLCQEAMRSTLIERDGEHVVKRRERKIRLARAKVLARLRDFDAALMELDTASTLCNLLPWTPTEIKQLTEAEDNVVFYSRSLDDRAFEAQLLIERADIIRQSGVRKREKEIAREMLNEASAMLSTLPKPLNPELQALSWRGDLIAAEVLSGYPYDDYFRSSHEYVRIVEEIFSSRWAAPYTYRLLLARAYEGIADIHGEDGRHRNLKVSGIHAQNIIRLFNKYPYPSRNKDVVRQRARAENLRELYASYFFLETGYSSYKDVLYFNADEGSGGQLNKGPIYDAWRLRVGGGLQNMCLGIFCLSGYVEYGHISVPAEVDEPREQIHLLDYKADLDFGGVFTFSLSGSPFSEPRGTAYLGSHHLPSVVQFGGGLDFRPLTRYFPVDVQADVGFYLIEGVPYAVEARLHPTEFFGLRNFDFAIGGRHREYHPAVNSGTTMVSYDEAALVLDLNYRIKHPVLTPVIRSIDLSLGADFAADSFSDGSVESEDDAHLPIFGFERPDLRFGARVRFPKGIYIGLDGEIAYQLARDYKYVSTDLSDSSTLYTPEYNGAIGHVGYYFNFTFGWDF